MPAELFANGASTVLAGNGGSITADATSFTVASAADLPAAVAGVSQFRAAFVNTTTDPPAVLEYLTVTNVTGSTLTVVRASEDAARYPAAVRADGTAVYQLVTAGALADLSNRSTVGQAAALALALGG